MWITRMELGFCWPVLVPVGWRRLWLLRHPGTIGLISEQTPAGLGTGKTKVMCGLEGEGLSGSPGLLISHNCLLQD